MMRMRCIGLMIGALVSGVAAAQAKSPTGRSDAASTDVWSRLVSANDLDVKGRAPFHIGMTFQLYDLAGKPAESGSFETWWTGEGPRRDVVHLAGLNEDGSAPEGADARLVRDSFLVRSLIELAIRPVSTNQTPATAVTKPFRYGKTDLECTTPNVTSAKGMDAEPSTVCADPKNTNVLVVQGLDGEMQMLRTKTGIFHDTFVPFEIHLYYVGLDAIAGKLTRLQAFVSANQSADNSATTVADKSVVLVKGGEFRGYRTKLVEPDYPMAAKISHTSGAVVLYAVIGKDGAIRSLVPIASAAQMFYDAAVQAVKQWRYSPYLLNGEPREVGTTITVNFALN